MLLNTGILKSPRNWIFVAFVMLFLAALLMFISPEPTGATGSNSDASPAPNS